MTTGWSYDKAGNETSAAPSGGTARTGETWTDHSQLKSLTTAGTTRALTHAGTDNAERTSLADTAFHHTALGLTGTTAAGVDTGFIREPAGTLNSVRNDGKSSYYLTDATGNVLGLVDETGKRTHTYAYTPYGTDYGAPVESFSQPYSYAGAYLDPTGLYKMGARYYDPHLGRFTQPDPSGQETNPYLYAAGDPINHSDPTGLSWVSAIAEGAGDVTEAISNGLNGDTDALWGQAAGIATGIAIESACVFVAGATVVPTGGVAAFALGAGCTVAAAAAGDYVGGKVEDGLKN
ncbi:RHS repeat-associated core domain-containing protein [Streptomyces sp. NPDC004330]|uniref:RHS repeat-associated core domain-containing protein n=1 Tax=Streptomyces sp. NPDC004330 TaxID=3364700 RepID=UPI0036A559AF